MPAKNDVLQAFDKFNLLFVGILNEVCSVSMEESQKLAEQATLKVLVEVIRKLEKQPQLIISDISQARQRFIDLTASVNQNELVTTVGKKVQDYVSEWAKQNVPSLNPIQRVQLAIVLEKNLNDFGI